MPELHITVRGRKALKEDNAEIICGNKDYMVCFDFDAEWTAYPAKTARFVWMDALTQKPLYADVLFEGDSVIMPAVCNTDLICIGVYAGDLITTTPARIPCVGCISDGVPPHEPPAEDIYLQLIDYLRQIAAGVGGIAGTPYPTPDGTADSVAGIPQRVLPDRAYIQSTGTQGIRCGFTPSSADVQYRIEFADFETPASGWGEIYGGYCSDGGKQPGGLGINGSRYGGNMVLSAGSGNMFGADGMPHTGYHEYTVTLSGSDVTIEIDGQITLTDTWSGDIQCPVGLCCGVSQSSGGTAQLFEFGTVKIYRFRIFENGTPVRDFVPALGADDRPAFYDNVSRTWFYSETGTDFIYVPAETEV